MRLWAFCKALGQFLVGPPGHRDPERIVGAARGGREADVGERIRPAGVAFQKGRPSSRHIPQSFGSGGRERQQEDTIGFSRDPFPGGNARTRRAAQNQVRVGAGESEGTDSREDRFLFRGQYERLRQDFDACSGPVDPRTGLVEVQTRRDRAMVEAQRRLDQPRHARRGFEVPDVCFHRTREQRAAGRAPLREHGGQSLNLNGVAGGRPGAVRFDIQDAGRFHARVFVCGAKQIGLSLQARRKEKRLAAVVADRAPGDNRVDAVPAGERVRHALENDHSAAFPPRVAVGSGIRELAPAVRREHPRFGESGGDRGTQNQVHAPRQRDIALVESQALAGQVDRNQRRRRSGVHHEGGSAEVKDVGDPSSRGETAAARGHFERSAGARGGHATLIVARPEAGKHAGPAAGDAFPREPRVFQGLPCHFEKKTVLGVHGGRFARGNPEKRRVEQVHPFEKPAPRERKG